jgi:glycosyltransferase involved in cell wall biosynthesis
MLAKNEVPNLRESLPVILRQATGRSFEALVIGNAMATVVPLRSGSGTRLKVVEALALGVAVVSTRQGSEGIRVRDGTHLLLAHSAGHFAAHVLRLLRQPELRMALGDAGGRLVEREHRWPQIVDQLEQIYVDLVESRPAERRKVLGR